MNDEATRMKIIRRLKQTDWLSTSEISLGHNTGGVRNVLDRTLAEKLAIKTPGAKGFLWALTSLGRLQTTEERNTMPPRRVMFEGTYTPPAWNVRAGADEHLQHRSLTVGV